ncbi:unnamed protein product [Nesidiocoris tenuis]|uniref:Uncharacterized protein n=1 Tax=Nesidiocoris tenuis TaxID=355587 RepID=A0A6H5G2L7_9HEMI|nr:unnamed protein product [Nesidiocoris tenuis]
MQKMITRSLLDSTKFTVSVQRRVLETFTVDLSPISCSNWKLGDEVRRRGNWTSFRYKETSYLSKHKKHSTTTTTTFFSETRQYYMSADVSRFHPGNPFKTNSQPDGLSSQPVIETGGPTGQNDHRWQSRDIQATVHLVIFAAQGMAEKDGRS